MAITRIENVSLYKDVSMMLKECYYNFYNDLFIDKKIKPIYPKELRKKFLAFHLNIDDDLVFKTCKSYDGLIGKIITQENFNYYRLTHDKKEYKYAGIYDLDEELYKPLKKYVVVA